MRDGYVLVGYKTPIAPVRELLYAFSVLGEYTLPRLAISLIRLLVECLFCKLIIFPVQATKIISFYFKKQVLSKIFFTASIWTPNMDTFCTYMDTPCNKPNTEPTATSPPPPTLYTSPPSKPPKSPS